MPLSGNQTLEQFQAFLECLAAIHIDPRLRFDPRLSRRFGWSEIINATLLEVALDLEKLRTMPPPDQERMLRSMLANNLIDRIRRELAQVRDIRRERSVKKAIENSSFRIRGWPPVDPSTPSGQLMRQEQALQLADALAQLPQRQREAIVLQMWHGWKLAQIAEHLQCTVGAVAGLQARGLARLRKILPADMLEIP
jgi:RNA polymerase sigma-70 factor (ECF subfamily)